MEKSTLADEAAAEIELGLQNTARTVASRLTMLNDVSKNLVELGLSRRLTTNSEGLSPTLLAGISCTSTTIPAFGGLLYGASAVGQVMSLAGTDILDSWQVTRVKMGDMDLYGVNERLRWQQIRLVYKILESIIQYRQINTILIDVPLFVSRREEATIIDDELVSGEWLDFSREINEFWNNHTEVFFPFNPNGRYIISIRSHAASSLFSALLNNPETTPDPTKSELSEYLKTHWVKILQLGQARLLEQILRGTARSLAYSYEDLNLDPRWQPGVLSELGILGFFLRSNTNTEIWHIQIPGHKSQWSTENINNLSSTIINSTLFNKESAFPLPLWFAKRSVGFPQALLRVFRASIEQELSHD
jgi:hypothetical protein